jgi:hypothetical protein
MTIPIEKGGNKGHTRAVERGRKTNSGGWISAFWIVYGMVVVC